MKKISVLLLLLLILSSPVFAAESQDGRSDKGPLARAGTVFVRGLANAGGLPVEFVRTTREEISVHPKAWPITFIPQGLSNVIYRACSAINDVIFHPFVALFTDDISPWTEGMGLPDYPWNFEK